MSKHTRFREVIDDQVTLLEQETGEGQPRRIRGVGAYADRVNLNRRLYPADVLRDAVRRAQAKLARSLGNGRYILGEADHPSGAPRVLDTVIKWESIEFNETVLAVELEGRVIPTDAGRNVIAMMESGVLPGISLRGYGDSELTDEGIEDVTYLELTGFDLVFEPAFEDAGVTVFEQQAQRAPTAPGDGPREQTIMNEDITKPADELVADEAVTETDDVAETVEPIGEASEPETTELDEAHAKLEAAEQALADAQARLGETEARLAELEALVRQAADEKAALEQAGREAAVEQAIIAGTTGLPYGEDVVEQLRADVRAAKPETVEAVNQRITQERARLDKLMEAARKQADAKAADALMKEQGMSDQLIVKGPVIEQELGIPEYAAYSHELREQLSRRGLTTGRDMNKGKSPAEIHARGIIESFDMLYRNHLVRENKAFEEATATSDLDLPYSVIRAVIAEAIPELVAANVFDFGFVDASPARLWFEAYAGETGVTATATAEVMTSDEGAWVDLVGNNLTDATVTVTNNAGNVTYTEWVDYMIDREAGRIWTFPTPGAIGDGATIKVTYTYNVIQSGEGAVIQRAKGTLAHADIAPTAMRLAGLVNDEAIALGQSQLGWDAVTRIVNMLISELREKIDAGIFRKALVSAVQSGNSGGTWTAASDSLDALVAKLGLAKVAVKNDHYNPTAIVASFTNADRLSNWTGVTRQGYPDALLGAAGFENLTIKGLPVYSSAQMPDSHILVVHRELVQHRVLSTRPMSLKGPFQMRDATTAKLIASQEWYVEEYNDTVSLVVNKGGYVKVA